MRNCFVVDLADYRGDGLVLQAFGDHELAVRRPADPHEGDVCARRREDPSSRGAEGCVGPRFGACRCPAEGCDGGEEEKEESERLLW